MAERQLILDLFDTPTEHDNEPSVDLFAPNGRRRCPHCRQRLTWWASRLICANPSCPGVT